MPGGAVVGTLFFVLLAFAALSSAIAGLEPAGAWLMEKFGLRRATAVSIVALACWLGGLAMAMSFSDWRDFHPLAAIERFRTATLFDLTDFFASNVLLPVGALLTSLLAGWRLDQRMIAMDLGRHAGVRLALIRLLEYVCPLAILAVLVSAI